MVMTRRMFIHDQSLQMMMVSDKVEDEDVCSWPMFTNDDQ